MRRIAWAGAGAQQRDGVRTDEVAALIGEWRTARLAAAKVVKRLIQAQRERQAKVSSATLEREPRKKLQNGQAHGSAEFVRTDVLVSLLVDDDSARDRIEDLAHQLGELGASVLDHGVRGSRDVNAAQRSLQRRLGDHFWCDVLAALVVALQEVRGVKDRLAAEVEDATAEMVAVVWREVKASRDSSHGWGPTSRKDGPTRAGADSLAGVDDAFLEAAVRFTVRRLVQLLPSPDLPLDQVLFELRVLTLLICPDPAGHELVWTNCWLPLVSAILADNLGEDLRQLDQFIQDGLAQPHTWDDPSHTSD